MLSTTARASGEGQTAVVEFLEGTRAHRGGASQGEDLRIPAHLHSGQNGLLCSLTLAPFVETGPNECCQMSAEKMLVTSAHSAVCISSPRPNRAGRAPLHVYHGWSRNYLHPYRTAIANSNFI
jgi:hypothetical protein